MQQYFGGTLITWLERDKQVLPGRIYFQMESLLDLFIIIFNIESSEKGWDAIE